MPNGKLRVVFKFTAAGPKITTIDLIADPGRLPHLSLPAPLDAGLLGRRSRPKL